MGKYKKKVVIPKEFKDPSEKINVRTKRRKKK